MSLDTEALGGGQTRKKMSLWVAQIVARLRLGLGLRLDLVSGW